MNWYGLSKFSSDDVMNGTQRSHVTLVSDYQRYICDAYACRVALTQMDDRISVSAMLSHDQLGGTHWTEFWRYKKSESSRANATYAEVKKAVDKVYEEFTGTKTPTSLLFSYLKEAVRDIDIDSKPRTRVPWVDWSKFQKGEKDWRSSIYGTRYPVSDGY